MQGLSFGISDVRVTVQVAAELAILPAVKANSSAFAPFKYFLLNRRLTTLCSYPSHKRLNVQFQLKPVCFDHAGHTCNDPLARQRLDEAAEKAKIELSTAVESEINIPFITSDTSGPRHLLVKLSRAKLEELTNEFIERAMTITKRAMEASPFKITDINEVILVGGQTIGILNHMQRIMIFQNHFLISLGNYF